MKRITILFFAFLFIVNIFSQTKYDFPQNIASPFVEDSSGKKITRDDVSQNSSVAGEAYFILIRNDVE